MPDEKTTSFDSTKELQDELRSVREREQRNVFESKEDALAGRCIPVEELDFEGVELCPKAHKLYEKFSLDYEFVVRVDSSRVEEIAGEAKQELGKQQDEYMRNGSSEKSSGAVSELATAYVMAQLELDCEVVVDDAEEDAFVGDFVYNTEGERYIMEHKTAMTDSKAHNIPARYHGEENSFEALCLNGMTPELLLLTFTHTNTLDGEYYVAVKGVIPTAPESNGLYNHEPRFLEKQGCKFFAYDKDKYSWFNLSQMETLEFKGSVVPLNEF